MNRNRFRAAFGAAAVVATLLASGAGVAPALAATTGDSAPQASHSAGDGKGKGKSEDESKGGKGKGKGGDKDGDKDAGKLAKAIAVTDAKLARLLKKADGLGADTYERFASGIAAERALLAELSTAADVRALQPENYEQVVAWLRKVEKVVAEVEAPDAAMVEAAAALVDQLLSITATSDRDDLRAVKRAIGDFKDLVEEAEVEEPADDSGTDPDPDPGTDPGTDPGDEGGDVLV